MYDWEVDEHGGLRPMVDAKRGAAHAIRSRSRPCANDSYILETILKKYNRHKIPGGSVNVQVEVWVQEITTISDITSDFQLDIYISEMWLDPALDYSWMDPCKYNLSLNSVLLEKLWTPNSCFINSKTADIHRSPFPNIFLMIYANGSVWTNYRLKLQGPCEMDLTRFPFDNVTCSLTFESFNYNTDEVQMSWSPLGVSKMREKMELADYELTGIENLRASEPYPAGFWHELTMKFRFKRRAGWSRRKQLGILKTILSAWISFALGSKAIPARTMLGVNSLLAMTFQFGNIIRNLPRVSYVKVKTRLSRNKLFKLLKAIDVWMLSCMTFVFCSLLELAWVGYLSREEDELAVKAAIQKASSSPMPSPATNVVSPRPPHYESNSALHRRGYTSEEECALMSLRDNDYGYIPPGYGLNGNLKSAMASFAGPCACTKEEPPEVYAPILQSAAELAAYRAGQNVSLSLCPCHEHLALQIDKLSSILFPSLFSVFNIAYWYHYLND
ncbi:unnamed protein product [Anisakis simplex]|uniref:Neurotransmitter-gated ion-channel ligand-binding domain-containing protein n=1 Tax=Anisakis simplex TaxID=6269 RepID=A0A3P6QY53_ANISI|nr:unnamed protein product [Anisakis simplex]